MPKVRTLIAVTALAAVAVLVPATSPANAGPIRTTVTAPQLGFSWQG
jgi:hypothetical protein